MQFINLLKYNYIKFFKRKLLFIKKHNYVKGFKRKPLLIKKYNILLIIKSLLINKKIKPILICFILFFCCSKSFAYWGGVKSKACTTYASVAVAEFEMLFHFNCSYANVIINQEFYNEFMTLNAMQEYEWKKDKYGNILNINEIKNLTNINTIIKSNGYCYLVKNSNYNLIDHGFPNNNNPLGWALIPLCLNYLSGWAYEKNHVVKLENEKYYSAKYYTTNSPLTQPQEWNKIEPVNANNFSALLTLPFANYSKPKLETIKRSYFWHNYTTYEVGDLVLYNQKEFICIKDNTNNIPPNNSWAWVLKIENKN